LQASQYCIRIHLPSFPPPSQVSWHDERLQNEDQTLGQIVRDPAFSKPQFHPTQVYKEIVPIMRAKDGTVLPLTEQVRGVLKIVLWRNLFTYQKHLFLI